MRRLLGFVFGFRRDLDLSRRWWHRLFQVAFALFSLAFLVIAVVGFQSGRYRPWTDKNSVRILLSLQDYIKQHPRLGNVIPAFLEEKGRLGIEEKNGMVTPLNYDVELRKSFCSADVRNHLGELAEFFNGQVEQSQSTDNVKPYNAEELGKWLEDKTVATRVCWTPKDVTVRPGEEKIVKWEYRLSAHVMSWGQATIAAFLTYLAAASVLLNIYYRGFVYILFGARRKEDAASIN